MYETITMGGAPYPGMKRDAVIRDVKAKNTMERPHECPSSVYEGRHTIYRK